MFRAIWGLSLLVIFLSGCEQIKDKLTYYDDAFKVMVIAKSFEPRKCESGFDAIEMEYWEECEGPFYTVAMIDKDRNEIVRNVSAHIYDRAIKGKQLWVKVRKWGQNGHWRFHSIHLNNPLINNQP